MGSGEREVRRRVAAVDSRAELQPEPLPSRRPDHDAIAADVELVSAAALAGFEGPAWGDIIAHLYPYAIATVAKWMRTGEIFRQMFLRKMSHPVMARSCDLTPEQRDEFARDLVTDVLWRFRRNVLMKGAWDPAHHTQLRTYFMGYVVYFFPDRYAALLDRVAAETPLDQEFDKCASEAGPEQVALDRHYLRAAIATADPSPSEVVLLSVWFEDLPLRVAAERLGISYKAAEYRRMRLRKRFQRALSA